MWFSICLKTRTCWCLWRLSSQLNSCQHFSSWKKIKLNLSLSSWQASMARLKLLSLLRQTKQCSPSSSSHWHRKHSPIQFSKLRLNTRTQESSSFYWRMRWLKPWKRMSTRFNLCSSKSKKICCSWYWRTPVIKWETQLSVLWLKSGYWNQMMMLFHSRFNNSSFNCLSQGSLRSIRNYSPNKKSSSPCQKQWHHSRNNNLK